MISDEQLDEWEADARLDDYRICELIKALRAERKWSAECEAKLKMIMSHADAISLNGGDTLNTHWIVNRCIETINQKPKEIIE